MIRKKIAILLAMLMMTIQSAFASGMEEFFYASGKIYVVIGVVAIVLVGLCLYLIMMDRKVKRLEEEVERRNEGNG